MIYENSRYEFERVVRVVDHQGTAHPAIYVSPDIDEQAFLFDLYMVTGTTRLDTLAYQLYGDAERWWVIARANPEVFYPDQIPIGTMLRIPYAA